MSLVGNLEDLGLGDILQIVSLSKKSGILKLSCGMREGTITFADGKVVQATSNLFQTSLDSLLLKHKLVMPDVLATVLDARADSGRTLSSMLISGHHISPDKLDALIKAQVERIVYNFFGWQEGTFDFQLEEATSPAGSISDLNDFTLERGLNPQWLVAEARRMVAEGRLLTASPDADLEVELPVSRDRVKPSSRKYRSGVQGPLFIIDDDAPTRLVLKKAFMRAGFEVEVFELSSELIKACAEKCRAGLQPALLIDLIMPRLDGHGILGGLEVMEIIAEKYPLLPMMLMTDHPNAEAEMKAKEFGGAVLRKPKKIDIREERGVEVLKSLLSDVERHLSQSGFRPDRKAADYDIGRDLVDEFDPIERKEVPVKEGSPGLYLLKGMLQELVNPLLSGGVILLILRFASEMFNRAVIFDVKNDEIIGIGQFGLNATTENADKMVRQLRLKVDAGSLIGQVLEGRCALRGSLGETASERTLQQQLGGIDSAEVFVGPLVSEGKVVAVIYGDNLPESKPVGNVEAFEVFLSQAGMAMEKVLLERGGRDST